MSIEVRGMTPLLSVFDMPASVRFYRDLLGFELTSHSPLLSALRDDFHWALLRLNGSDLMLNTAYDEGDVQEGPTHRAWHSTPTRSYISADRTSTQSIATCLFWK